MKLLRTILLLTLPVALLIPFMTISGNYLLRQTWAQTRGLSLEFFVLILAIGFLISVVVLPIIACVRSLDKVPPPFPKDKEH